MESYLEPLRRAALGIMDSGHPVDGGVFRLINEDSMLQRLYGNRTIQKELIISHALDTILSFESLFVVTTSCILAIGLLICMTVFACCRKQIRAPWTLRSHACGLYRRTPRIGFAVLRILGAGILLLEFISLATAFTTNIWIYAESHRQAGDSVHGSVERSFQFLDSFFQTLVPNARIEMRPIVSHALEKTETVRRKSQANFRRDFENEISAKVMKESSSELLKSVRFFYNFGLLHGSQRVALNKTLEGMKQKTAIIKSSDKTCIEAKFSPLFCDKHRDNVNQANKLINLVLKNWTKPPEISGEALADAISAAMKKPEEFAAALRAMDSSPEHLAADRDRRLNLSRSLNKVISRAFDRDLNTTAFVINGFEKNLVKLETQVVRPSRQSLRNLSGIIGLASRRLITGFENARFGIATVVLVPSIVVAAVLTFGFTVVIVTPARTSRVIRRLRPWLTAGYLTCITCLLLALAVFCLTNYARTQGCRYFEIGEKWDEVFGNSSADAYLVPEVNKVLRHVRSRRIPVTAIGSVIGGISNGCRANKPLLLALDAIQYINVDLASQESAEKAQRFKESGTKILRRELDRANITRLYDSSQRGKLEKLAKLTQNYSSVNYERVSQDIRYQLLEAVKPAAERLLSVQTDEALILNGLNKSTDRKFIESNLYRIRLNIGLLHDLKNLSLNYANMLTQLDKHKMIASIATRLISATSKFKTFSQNKNLWIETAIKHYIKSVVNDTTDDSLTIARESATEFLAKIGSCRRLFDFYWTFVGVPCRSLLNPLSVLWLCLAVHLCCAVPLLVCGSLVSVSVRDEFELFDHKADHAGPVMTNYSDHTN
ncbi:hypothetical protein BOX15_Mlig006484g2 [Macrostomum lignano]|uniref:Uncharacterized protein n=1 Tax=Macrostomum lignano TaxID=282301 RepID=A0A267EIY1_9PLAT|nr:hypothetical protein BOX15_Mlig006484g2 [Macrostomum lignano]